MADIQDNEQPQQEMTIVIDWYDLVETYLDSKDEAKMTDSILTLEKLQEAIDLVYPPLYYGTDRNIERGVVYLCKETDFNPEFLICHPDDLHEVKQITTVRRLVHLKDEPKDKVMDRILRNLKMKSVEVFTTKGA